MGSTKRNGGIKIKMTTRELAIEYLRQAHDMDVLYASYSDLGMEYIMVRLFASPSTIVEQMDDGTWAMSIDSTAKGGFKMHLEYFKEPPSLEQVESFLRRNRDDT